MPGIPGRNPGRVTRSPPQREIVKLPRRLRRKSGRRIPTYKLTANIINKDVHFVTSVIQRKCNKYYVYRIVNIIINKSK